MQMVRGESVANLSQFQPVSVFQVVFPHPLILASGSPRRADLLRQLGVSFNVKPSEAPEIQHDQFTAREAAQVNAYRKARSVAKKFPDWVVLGADTLVCQGARVFGKPANLDDAYRMLEELEGTEHQVVTAICLMHLRARRQTICSEGTEVRFRPLTAVDIRRYLTQVNPLDKAGAYAIQEHGDWIVEGVRGSYSNVVGLPLERLSQELNRWTRRA